MCEIQQNPTVLRVFSYLISYICTMGHQFSSSAAELLCGWDSVDLVGNCQIPKPKPYGLVFSIFDIFGFGICKLETKTKPCEFLGFFLVFFGIFRYLPIFPFSVCT